MKNVIKKVTALAMAFTLLGAGGTVAANSKSFTNSGTAITANAASVHNMRYIGTRTEVRNHTVYIYRVYECSCGAQYRELFQQHSC